MAYTTDRPIFDGMPTVSESGIDLLYDITASTIWADGIIQYGFGGSDALGFDDEFRQFFRSMMGNARPDAQFAFLKLAVNAFDRIDSVTALDFEATDKLEEVDLVLVSTDDKPQSNLEGFFQFPGEFDHDYAPGESWSLGAFNSALGALKAKPELGGGQYANWTVMHEIGHSLGLKHTHQEVNGIPALPSVGKYMDNERYSVMSYKPASDDVHYGHAVSMMALDVAALQALYGEEDYAAGGSSYTLMDARGGKLSLAEGDVQIGRAYYCIWDSGSTDVMKYEGSKHSVLINLNDATLDTSGNSADLEALFAQIRATNFFDYMSKSLKSGIFDEWHNAGGFFSQVLDVKNHKFVGTDGGYSIAHGAEIEDAWGGKGADLIIGNEQDNSVLGGNGDDTILGAAGSDRLAGDRGSDWIDGGTGNDYLWGDQGRDIFVFSNGYGDDMIMDFEDSDIIDLRGLTGVASYADLFDNHMFQVGDDVVIEVGSDTLTLRDVTLGELTVKHFAM